MTLGFIGTGAITEAIVKGLIKADLSNDSILVSARNAAIARDLSELSSRVRVVEDNQEIVDQSKIVFLAVRPQVARDVLAELKFSPDRKVVSLLATITSETVREWIGSDVHVTRAIPLPSVAELTGVTAVYPEDPAVEALFGDLGTVVAAGSLAEFDGYAAASSLMGTYFLLLHNTAVWLAERGASEERARQYIGHLFYGLAKTSLADPRNFEDLVAAHSTPKGLNEQAWHVFEEKGGARAIQTALTAVVERIKRSITSDKAK